LLDSLLQETEPDLLDISEEQSFAKMTGA